MAEWKWGGGSQDCVWPAPQLDLLPTGRKDAVAVGTEPQCAHFTAVTIPVDAGGFQALDVVRVHQLHFCHFHRVVVEECGHLTWKSTANTLSKKKTQIRYSMNFTVGVTKWKVMTTPHPPTPPQSTRIRTCHTNWLKQSSTMKHGSNTNLLKYQMYCVNCNAFYFLNHIC